MISPEKVDANSLILACCERGMKIVLLDSAEVEFLRQGPVNLRERGVSRLSAATVTHPAAAEFVENTPSSSVGYAMFSLGLLVGMLLNPIGGLENVQAAYERLVTKPAKVIVADLGSGVLFAGDRQLMERLHTANNFARGVNPSSPHGRSIAEKLSKVL